MKYKVFNASLAKFLKESSQQFFFAVSRKKPMMNRYDQNSTYSHSNLHEFSVEAKTLCF